METESTWTFREVRYRNAVGEPTTAVFRSINQFGVILEPTGKLRVLIPWHSIICVTYNHQDSEVRQRITGGE